MSKRESFGKAAQRRSAWLLTLAGAGLAACVPACDRPPGNTATTSPATTGRTGSAVGDASTFKPPTPDISTFPAPVRAAYSDWRNKLDQNPKDRDLAADLSIYLGSICFVHGSAQDAVTFFRRAAELQPEHRVGHYYLGLAQEKAGDAAGAVASFESALKYDPELIPGYIRIGTLLLDKDAAKAKASFEKAIEVASAQGVAARIPQANYGLGRLAKAAGNNEEALKQFDQATTYFPLYVDAHKEAADCAKALGRTAPAAEHEARAAAGGRTPPMPDPLLGDLLNAGMDMNVMIQFAHLAMSARDFAAAEERLLKAMAMDPGVNARIAMATLRLREGKIDEAASLAQNLLDANPKSAVAATLMAEVKLAQRKSDEAIALLRQAVELDENDYASRRLLGRLLSGSDRDASRKLGTRAVEIAPTAFEAYELLIYLGVTEKKWGEAEQWYRKGLQQLPNSDKLMNGLAWLLATCPEASRRNPAEAVKLAELACQMTRNQAHEYLDTLAAAYASAGRFEDAVSRVQEAIKLATDAGPIAASNVEDYRKRLALYQDRKAYTDPA